jgi:hypothetical protein
VVVEAARARQDDRAVVRADGDRPLGIPFAKCFCRKG